RAAGGRSAPMNESSPERYTLDTLAGRLAVVRAQPPDGTEVLSILEEARQWLLSRGMTEQWPGPHPPDAIAWRIAHHQTYLAYLDGQAIATFTLQCSD